MAPTVHDNEARIPRGKTLAPAFALGTGIAVSCVLFFVIRDNIENEAKLRFERQASVEARVRKDTSLDPRGYPKFAVIPPGNRAEYYVLTYVEPMAGNESVFGLDISNNPSAANPRSIADALASARDSGKLTSSGQLLRIKGSEGSNS